MEVQVKQEIKEEKKEFESQRENFFKQRLKKLKFCRIFDSFFRGDSINKELLLTTNSYLVKASKCMIRAE